MRNPLRRVWPHGEFAPLGLRAPDRFPPIAGEEVVRRRQRILKPYVNSRSLARSLPVKAIALAGLSLFCLIYGAAFALFAPYLVTLFLIPICLVLLLVIWALPETGKAPTRTLCALFWVFFVVLIVWPNYLAIALPGLPWITLTRITAAPVAFLFMCCLSFSKSFRGEINNAMQENKIAAYSIIFVGIYQLISVLFSDSTFFSVTRLILYQTDWTAIYFTSIYFFARQGRVWRWSLALWVVSLIVCAIAIAEAKYGQVLWANHIPSFLKINTPDVQLILAGQVRSAIGVHRIQSTFSTALGLAEFLAYTTPFIIHFAVMPGSVVRRLAALATLPLFLAVIVSTDSRLGMIGFGASVLFYGIVWALFRRRNTKDPLLSTAVTVLYPALFCMAVSLTFVSHRLHNSVWGSGAEKASNQSRVDQWHQAIPMILSRPWGYGVGTSGATLGYTNDAGVVTIDSFYIIMLLECGIVGFAVWAITFSASTVKGVRGLLAQPTGLSDEMTFLVPLASATFNFIVIKGVFAQPDNHPMIYMVVGATTALLYRRRKTAESERPDSNSEGSAAALAHPLIPPAIRTGRP